MKKNILLLFLLLIGHLAQAQKENKEAERDFYKAAKAVTKYAIKQKDINIFNDFASKNTPPTEKSKAWIYANRAYILTEINYRALKFGETNTTAITREIIDNYQKAIDSCAFCAASYKEQRMIFLKKYKITSDVLVKDKADLEAIHYKPSREGSSLGVAAIQGKDTWIGLQFVPYGSKSARYLKLSNNQDVAGYYKKSTYGVFFPLSINYNLQRKTTEFSMSFLRMQAPLMIDITQFGYRNGVKGEQGSGFYRPEIGFGIGYFSLSYGYNVWFNKTYHANEEKHLLQLRFTPILKSK